MGLRSINNKTTRLTFIFFPSQRFSGVAGQSLYSLKRSHTRLSKQGPSETEVIDDQYIERGDQFLNFKEGELSTELYDNQK